MVLIMSNNDGGGQAKLRMTRQRRVVLEALAGVRTHPTAEEVYRMVRRRLPRISLGTVYRNLELLSERGLIGKLEAGGSRRRFDAEVREHYHVRCLGCGRVEDVSARPVIASRKAVGGESGYEIVGHRLEWVGLCPECTRKRAKSHEDDREKGRKGAREWQ